MLEDGRVPSGGRFEVYQSLACSQRREEPHHGDALRQRGGHFHFVAVPFCSVGRSFLFSSTSAPAVM